MPKKSQTIDQIAEDIESHGLLDLLVDSRVVEALTQEISEELGTAVPKAAIRLILRFILEVAVAGVKSLGSSGLNSLKAKLLGRVSGSAVLGPVLEKISSHIERLRDKAAKEKLRSKILSGELNLSQGIEKGLATNSELITWQSFAKLLESSDEVLRSLESISKPQPPLTLPIGPSKGPWSILYRSRAARFRGRELELSTLKEWLEEDTNLSWTILLGPGGSGKSHLAQELALRVGGVWKAGFLLNDTSYDWSSFEPMANTLIMVDYAASRAAEVRDFIYIIGQKQNQFPYKIRILLIERQVLTAWSDIFFEGGRKLPFVESSRSVNVPFLHLKNPPVDIQRQIFFDAYLDAQHKAPSASKIEATAIDKTSNQRPLFLVIAAHLGSSANLDQYDESYVTDICRKLISREFHEFSKNAGGTRVGPGLLASASALSQTGLAISKLKASKLNKPSFLIEELNQLVAEHPAGVDGIRVRAIEPDIVGEVFFIDFCFDLSNQSESDFKLFLTILWELDTQSVLSFVSRLWQDFPTNDTVHKVVGFYPMGSGFFGQLAWCCAIRDYAVSKPDIPFNDLALILATSMSVTKQVSDNFKKGAEENGVDFWEEESKSFLDNLYAIRADAVVSAMTCLIQKDENGNMSRGLSEFFLELCEIAKERPCDEVRNIFFTGAVTLLFGILQVPDEKSEIDPLKACDQVAKRIYFREIKRPNFTLASERLPQYVLTVCELIRRIIEKRRPSRAFRHICLLVAYRRGFAGPLPEEGSIVWMVEYLKQEFPDFSKVQIVEPQLAGKNANPIQ
ncbi:MAG: hypothetical protein RIF37_15310 [Rhodospirillaceae bacterium]